MNFGFIQDTSFLKQLYEQINIEEYVKIISFNLDGVPQEEIVGRATAGSVNVDGASSLRRTCQLTLLCEENQPVTDAYWSFLTEFKVYKGLRNFVDSRYDDICWFPQGTFLIQQFSNSYNEQGFTINITGKDKMCKLNGECGGVLPVTIDFAATGGLGELENNALIYDIIREAVHVWGNEPYHNIIINDIAETAFNILEYRCENMQIEIKENGTQYEVSFTGAPRDPANNIYGYGDTVGYEITDFVYPGEKTAAAGQPVTTGILDPIVQLLGNYEYFYDLDGRFIFQEKRNYLNNSWSPEINEGDDLINGYMYLSPYSYEFLDGKLIKSYSRNPQLNNIKNDFVVWGTKKSGSGASVPIHMRLSLHDKPSEETIPEAYHVYLDNSPGGWRHALYRMALDNVPSNYEFYYADMIEFWDEIFNTPSLEQVYNAIDVYKKWGKKDTRYKIAEKIYNIYSKEGKNNYQETLKFLSGVDKVYDLSLFSNTDIEKEKDYSNYELEIDVAWNKKLQFKEGANKQDLSIQDILNPEDLIFWFDILDNESEISQYKISNIGLRTKAVNDKNVTSIAYRDIPTILFVRNNELTEMEKEKRESGNTIVNLPDGYENYFQLSTRTSTTAYSLIEEYLYRHLYFADSISISTVPILHLQPNTTITVIEGMTGIGGNYVVNSISIPLASGEFSNISAVKSVEKLY